MLGEHVSRISKARDLTHRNDAVIGALHLLEEAYAASDVCDVLHGGSVLRHGNANLVVTPENDRLNTENAEGDET